MKQLSRQTKTRLTFAAKLVLLLLTAFVFAKLGSAVNPDTASGDIADTPHIAVNLILSLLILFGLFFKWKIPAAVSWVFISAVPAAHLLLVELLMPRTREIVPKMFLLNVIFYYAAFAALFFLCRKHSEIAVLIGTVTAWLAGTVNCVAWAFRSLPVLPWDLYSAKTALSVVQNYDFPMTHTFVTIQLAFVCIAVLGFRLKIRQWAPPAVHWPIAALSVLLLAGYGLFLQTDTVFSRFGGYRYLFTPTVYYERNGAAVSFVSTLHYLNVQKPSGYHAEDLEAEAMLYAEEAEKEAKEALEKAQNADKATDVLPNVIIIMNETFSDLRSLCEYETNLPVTPFIDSLEENTLKGNLHVSVKGGNTPNTEFETLTGSAMAFLPVGSIPYQQHIKGPTPNLATHLKSLGYTTEAMHPYYKSGWNRTKIYPYFGFDRATFLEDMYPIYASDLLRGYISDETMFEYMIDQYENKESGQPMFFFGVTMQNHGSYDKEYANFRPDVKVTGLEEYKRLSTYLSLIRKTDAYFEELIHYFEKADEKTVIVMFGDHQPNDSVVGKLMQTNDPAYTKDDLDAPKRYITPYVLWANFDIDESLEEKDMSVNFMSQLLLRAAGIPLSGYQRFISETAAEFPVLSVKNIMDRDGNTYDPDQLAALQKEHEKLSLYQKYAYNQIFDAKNRIEPFFH